MSTMISTQWPYSLERTTSPSSWLSLNAHSNASTLYVENHHINTGQLVIRWLTTSLTQTSSSHNCNPSSSCFCTDQNITTAYMPCIMSSCPTPVDLLAAQRYQAETCNFPVRNKGGILRDVVWSTLAFATLFTIFRGLSRMKSLGGTGFSWDDAILFTSYALAVVIVAATEMQIINGSGRVEYTLSVDQIVSYTYVSLQR